MTKGEQALVIGAMEMVDGMVGRYCGQGASREDLVQEGYLCLCMAAMRYDESRGVSFTTYAFNYVRKGMKCFLKRGRGSVMVPAVDEQLAQMPTESCYEADYDLLEEERRREMAEAMEGLTPCERRVIEGLYGLTEEAVEAQELAKRMDVGLDRIYKLKYRGLSKMGEQLAERLRGVRRRYETECLTT